MDRIAFARALCTAVNDLKPPRVSTRAVEGAVAIECDGILEVLISTDVDAVGGTAPEVIVTQNVLSAVQDTVSITTGMSWPAAVSGCPFPGAMAAVSGDVLRGWYGTADVIAVALAPIHLTAC